ncbi:MAG: glycosyltransferase family 2 protein [Candidatus Omnitrophota bacterium]|nr:MAG: glycosyltransferase family 2 protein [Candidatus Omnitrophota bacterium]
MEYSVVIPLFNEAQSLEMLQTQLYDVMESIAAGYEVIYVNDGSSDESSQQLEKLRQRYPNINIISFKTNRGQSAALHAGFKAAKGQWLITLDADGQNPPREITKLLKIKDAFDFVTGIRTRRRDNLIRKISSQVAKFFRWVVLGDTTQDTGCSLRIFRKEIVDSVPFFKNFHRFFVFLVRRKGFLVKEVPVAHNARRFGKSKYRFFKRMVEGIFDLWGLFWISRRLNYESGHS